MGNLASFRYHRVPVETPEDEDTTKESASSSCYHSSFHELRNFLKPYYWPADRPNQLRCLGTWLMVALSKLCNISSPLFLSYATNSIIQNHYQTASLYLFAHCLMRFMAIFFQEMQSMVYLSVKQAANVLVNETAFAHIHSLSYHWHTSKKTGSVLRILDRGGSAFPGVLESVAVLLIFVVRFDWMISIIVCIGVSMYITVTRSVTVQRKKISFRLRSNRQDNQYHQIANDSISNFEVVKSCANEVYETKRYTTSVNEYQLSLRKIQSATVILKVVQAGIVNITLLCNLLITFRSLSRGEATVGDFVAVSAYTLSVFSPLNTLGGIFNSIVQCLADVDNLLALLSVVPDVTDSDEALSLNFPRGRLSSGKNDSGISIQFEDVTFRYPDQSPEQGLQKISFYVPPGTTMAIVGPTGSGKTSISRLLFRFYDPQEGIIRVGDSDIKTCSQFSLRRCIGIVPQDTALFNDTLLYNIRYGRQDASLAEVEGVIELAHIKAFVDSLPDGLNTQVGERGIRLSGGEKQRVAIARCLLQDPPIVILDEATAALDTVTEKNIQDALTALGTNRTVLVIAHRLTTIKNADNIIVLENGKIVESGNHQQLLEKGGMYASMWAQHEEGTSPQCS